MIFIDRSIAAAVRLHYELPGRVRGPRGPDKGANQLVERSLTRATSVGSSWPIRSACHPVSLSHSPPLSSQTCCNFYRWACLPLLDITGHQSPARTAAASLELCHGLSAWDTFKKKKRDKVYCYSRFGESHAHTFVCVWDPRGERQNRRPRAERFKRRSSVLVASSSSSPGTIRRPGLEREKITKCWWSERWKEVLFFFYFSAFELICSVLERMRFKKIILKRRRKRNKLL